jgi:formyltetrahydrofolate synthetase
VLTGALAGVIGCRRPAPSVPGVTVQSAITPQPVRAGAAAVTVKLADASGSPIPHASVSVEADMSHPGMSPVFGAAHEVAPGSYKAAINLTMGGDWVVVLHIRLADGRKLERQIDVRGVLPN